MTRVEPLVPPYEPEIGEALSKWMPPGVPHEPLRLFRVLHRHPKLASRMRVLGAGLLAHGELPALDREIVITRACARAGCRYEWGVHAATLAAAAGLTPEQLRATALDAPVWSGRHRTLLRAVDELHDTADVSDGTWDELARHYGTEQLVEVLVLAGWYRTISGVAKGLRVEPEPWAAPYPEE